MLVVTARSSVAAATPWGDRCKARLAKVAPSLKSLGKATITIAPPPAARKPGSNEFKDLDPIGELSLVITAGNHTFTVTIGSDHSGHRYRGRRGIEEKRYEEWHSPYVDSLNGNPPDDSEQPMLEELHHHLDGGVVRAELRVDVAVPESKRKARPVPSTANQHAQGPLPPGAPTYTGKDKLFADTLRPVLEACWTDVLPDEADESLAWTTKCLAELSLADAALVKLDPIFKNGTCARERFGASCGNVKGAEPTWNAMTSLVGGAKPKLVWIDEGNNRTSYADGGALIWSSDQLRSAQFAELLAAFKTPLEHCSQLLRTNMYGP